jgi:hypothetical protein
MNVAQPHQSNQVALAEQHGAIPDVLSNDLVRTLATLQGAETRAAQALIASLSYGSRATLSAYQLIEPIHRDSDAISPITITPAGWRVIRACAEAYSPTEGDEAEWAAELQAAEASYRAGRFTLGDGLAASLRRARKLVGARHGSRGARL